MLRAARRTPASCGYGIMKAGNDIDQALRLWAYHEATDRVRLSASVPGRECGFSEITDYDSRSTLDESLDAGSTPAYSILFSQYYLNSRRICIQITAAVFFPGARVRLRTAVPLPVIFPSLRSLPVFHISGFFVENICVRLDLRFLNGLIPLVSGDLLDRY